MNSNYLQNIKDLDLLFSIYLAADHYPDKFEGMYYLLGMSELEIASASKQRRSLALPP